jgi:hypothetical protein
VNRNLLGGLVSLMLSVGESESVFGLSCGQAAINNVDASEVFAAKVAELGK